MLSIKKGKTGVQKCKGGYRWINRPFHAISSCKNTTRLDARRNGYSQTWLDEKICITKSYWI